MGYYFDPIRYLAFAKRVLSKASDFGDSDAVFRSVVGRCYYSAFLKARDFLNLTQEKGKDVHEIVEDQVKARDFVTGSQLGELRKERNRADYHLDQNVGLNQASKAVLQAETVIQNLN